MRPSNAKPDRFSSERVVGIEGANAVLETAFDRWIEVGGRIAPIEPPNCPLPGLRIVRSQADSANFASLLLEHIVAHVDPPIHHLARGQSAFEFIPFVAVRETFFQ